MRAGLVFPHVDPVTHVVHLAPFHLAHLWDQVALAALTHELDQLYATDQWPAYYDLPPLPADLRAHAQTS